MRMSGVFEEYMYVQAVQDMYYSGKTTVRTPVGVTESFEVKVGVHQSTALTQSFLYIMILEKLTEDIR